MITGSYIIQEEVEPIGIVKCCICGKYGYDNGLSHKKMPKMISCGKGFECEEFECEKCYELLEKFNKKNE